MSYYVSHPFDLLFTFLKPRWHVFSSLGRFTNSNFQCFFNLTMLQNNGNVIGAGSKEHFFKKMVLLHYVWMPSLCIFDHAFLPHPKPFLSSFFSSNSYGCLLSTHDIFLSLKSGSKVKISKNLELLRLPKTKKISLSTMGIFHISTKSIFFTWKDPAWSHLQLYEVEFPKF